MGCTTRSDLHKLALKLQATINKGLAEDATAKDKANGKAASDDMGKVNKAIALITQKAFFDTVGIQLNEAALTVADEFEASYSGDPEYIKLQNELKAIDSNLTSAKDAIADDRYYKVASKFGVVSGDYKDRASLLKILNNDAVHLKEMLAELTSKLAKQESALNTFNSILKKASKLSIDDAASIEVKREATLQSVYDITDKISELNSTLKVNASRAKQATKNITITSKLLTEKELLQAIRTSKLIEISEYKASKSVGAKVLNNTTGKVTKAGETVSRLSNFLKPKVVFNRLGTFASNIAEGFKSITTSALSSEEVDVLDRTQEVVTKLISHINNSVDNLMAKDMADRDVSSVEGAEGYQSLSQLLLVEGKLSQEVVTAMAVIATEWMANVSLMRASVRDDRGNRSILGKSAGESINHAELEAISDIDMFVTAEASSLGADVVKLIGLNADVDSDKNAVLKKAKLENEIGLIIMHGLVEAGIVTLDSREANKIFLAKDPTNVTKLNFLRFTARGNKYLDNKNHLANKAARLVGKIFNTDKKLKRPRSSEAKTIVVTNADSIQGKNTTVNTTVQKGINAARNVEWFWNDSFVGDIFVMLEEEGGRAKLEEMLGFVDPTTKHKRFAKAVASENARVQREISQLEDARAEAIRRGEPSLFFDYFYGKNGRLYVESNTFNPQLSKLHMLAVYSGSSPVTTQRDMDLYDVAMAGAFGIKTDKLTFSTSIAGNEGIRTKWARTEKNLLSLDIDGKSLLEVLEAIEEHNKTASKIDKIGGYGAKLIAGIVEFRKYSAAKLANGNTAGVKTTLIMEIDGVTNGYILKSLQMPLLRDMKSVLQSGGVFIGKRVDKKPELTEYQEFVPDSEGTGGVVFEYSSTAAQISDPETLDAYETPAADMDSTFQEVFGKRNSQPESHKRVTELVIGAELGALNGDGKKATPEITRDFMKPHFMTFNYGAGITGIVQDMADTAIDVIYTNLERLHALDVKDRLSTDEATEKSDIIEQVDALLRAGNDSWVKTDAGWELADVMSDADINRHVNQFHEALNSGNILAYNIPMGVQLNLESSIKASIGVILEDTFSVYKPFVEAARTINNSFITMFRLFKVKLDRAISEAEALHNRPLTEAESDEIIATLKESMPAIKTALGDGIDDRLIIMDDAADLVVPEDSSKLSITPQTKYRYNEKAAIAHHATEIEALEKSLTTAAKGVEYNKIADKIKALKSDYLSSYAKQRKLVEAIASGAVITIHFIDGVLMSATLAHTNGMGNHDAVYESPTSADTTSKVYDKTMAEVATSYSLTIEILNSLLGAINKAEKGDIKAINQQFMDEAYMPDKADTVQNILQSLQELATESETARQELFSNPIRYDHLSNEGGHYDWNMTGEKYTTKTASVDLLYEFSSDDDAEIGGVSFEPAREFTVTYPEGSNPTRASKSSVLNVRKTKVGYLVKSTFTTKDGEIVTFTSKVSPNGLNNSGKVKYNVAELDAALNGDEVKSNINIYSTDKNGYEGLSNLNAGPVELKGITFKTIEHAFQYWKASVAAVNKEAAQASVLAAKNGYEAQAAGQKSKMQIDTAKWTPAVAEKALRTVMQRYYAGNKEAQQLLLSTGAATITHNNTKGYAQDARFPEILMGIRSGLSGTEGKSTQVISETASKGLGATEEVVRLNEVIISDEEYQAIKKSNQYYKDKHPKMFSFGNEYRFHDDTNTITLLDPSLDNDVDEQMHEVYTAHEIAHALTWEYLNDPANKDTVTYLKNALKVAKRDFEPGFSLEDNLLADRLKYASTDGFSDIHKVAELVAILSSEPNIRKSFIAAFPQTTRSKLEKILDVIKAFIAKNIGMEDTGDVIATVDAIMKAGKINPAHKTNSTSRGIGAIEALGSANKEADAIYMEKYKPTTVSVNNTRTEEAVDTTPKQKVQMYFNGAKSGEAREAKKVSINDNMLTLELVKGGTYQFDLNGRVTNGLHTGIAPEGSAKVKSVQANLRVILDSLTSSKDVEYQHPLESNGSAILSTTNAEGNRMFHLSPGMTNTAKNPFNNNVKYLQYSEMYSNKIIDVIAPTIIKDSEFLTRQFSEGFLDHIVLGEYSPVSNTMFLAEMVKEDVDFVLDNHYGKSLEATKSDAKPSDVSLAATNAAVIREYVNGVDANYVRFHELVHAGSVAYMLANPEDKLTKRVQELYEDVMQNGSLDPNGIWMRSKEEFLAEGMSNPDVIKALMGIKPKTPKEYFTNAFDVLIDTALSMLGLDGKRKGTIHDYLVDTFTAMLLTQEQSKIDNDTMKNDMRLRREGKGPTPIWSKELKASAAKFKDIPRASISNFTNKELAIQAGDSVREYVKNIQSSIISAKAIDEAMASTVVSMKQAIKEGCK